MCIVRSIARRVGSSPSIRRRAWNFRSSSCWVASGRRNPRKGPTVGHDWSSRSYGLTLGSRRNLGSAWSAEEALRGRGRIAPAAVCGHDESAGFTVRQAVRCGGGKAVTR